MLTGPIPACKKILERNKMTAKDIDLVEVNEAFAPVPMITMQEIGFPHDKVNVNGGAIALGHPLGATGAMLIGTIVDELERRNQKVGLTTMCIGLGMGSRRSSNACSYATCRFLRGTSRSSTSSGDSVDSLVSSRSRPSRTSLRVICTP
jgi:hypothetical protein